MEDFTMNDQKHAFFEYLTNKKRAQKTIDEYMGLFDQFGDTPPFPTAIGAFVGEYVKSHNHDLTGAKKKYQFLEEYAAFCNTHKNSELPLLADAIHTHIRDHFDGLARRIIAAFKRAIIPIPKDTIIDPQYLNGLTNNEFVAAFGKWQEIMGDVYNAIAQGSPFAWGWPGWRGMALGDNYNFRVIMMLDAIVQSGRLVGDTMVVNKKAFFAHNVCKPQKNAILLLKGLADYGFCIDGLENKQSETFNLSCHDDTRVMSVIQSYFTRPHSPSHQKNHIYTFSYRYVEQPQQRDVTFLARADVMSPSWRAVHYWLYDDAVKHGVWTTAYHAEFPNSIVYAKKSNSSQRLLIQVERNFMMCRLKKVFEKHPEKITEMITRFSDIFKQKWNFCDPCKSDCKFILSYGQGHCCGFSDFRFENITLDDAKFIFELFKLEHNIKAPRRNV